MEPQLIEQLNQDQEQYNQWLASKSKQELRQLVRNLKPLLNRQSEKSSLKNGEQSES